MIGIEETELGSVSICFVGGCSPWMELGSPIVLRLTSELTGEPRLTRESAGETAEKPRRNRGETAEVALLSFAQWGRWRARARHGVISDKPVREAPRIVWFLTR